MSRRLTAEDRSFLARVRRLALEAMMDACAADDAASKPRSSRSASPAAVERLPAERRPPPPRSPMEAAASLGRGRAGTWPVACVRFPHRPLTELELGWLAAEGRVPPGVRAAEDRRFALANGITLYGLNE